MKNLKQSIRTQKDHFRDIQNENKQSYLDKKLSTRISDKTYLKMKVEEDPFYNILPWKYVNGKKEYILDNL
jgi:hypothetical protein